MDSVAFTRSASSSRKQAPARTNSSPLNGGVIFEIILHLEWDEISLLLRGDDGACHLFLGVLECRGYRKLVTCSPGTNLTATSMPDPLTRRVLILSQTTTCCGHILLVSRYHNISIHISRFRKYLALSSSRHLRLFGRL